MRMSFMHMLSGAFLEVYGKVSDLLNDGQKNADEDLEDIRQNMR